MHYLDSRQSTEKGWILSAPKFSLLLLFLCYIFYYSHPSIRDLNVNYYFNDFLRASRKKHIRVRLSGVRSQIIQSAESESISHSV